MMRRWLLVCSACVALSAALLAAEKMERIGPRPDLRLAAYPSLRAKVSSTLVREDLAKAVAVLAEKSGTKLSVSDAVKAEGLRLTMSIRDMPLAEAMTAIALLYGLQWSKIDEGFTLEHYHSSLTPNMRRLMRAAPLTRLSDLLSEHRHDSAAGLARSLDESLTDTQRDQLPRGLPLNSLPPQVQQKVTDLIRRAAVSRTLGDMRRMCPDNLISAQVRKIVSYNKAGQESFSISIRVGNGSIGARWTLPRSNKQ